MSAKPAQLPVRCPDCGSDLTVDAQTGEVLFHKKPKAPPAGGKDLDSLFADMRAERSRADDVFEREKAALKDRDRLMEEKFRQAWKRAEEEPDEGRPLRPIDMD
jgi:hypothetical protein